MNEINNLNLKISIIVSDFKFSLLNLVERNGKHK